MSSQQILTTVMTNIVVEKRTDRTEPLSTFFFFYHNVDVKIYFRVIHKSIARHVDASSIVSTLLNNSKLANQISILLAMW